MPVFSAVYRAVEHLSAGKAAAIGGAGSGVSVVTAALANPTVLETVALTHAVPWLQVAILAVGLLTGCCSLALVLMKIVQQRRDMRG